MRSMSMLQLLGGVAVAGAVAAGSTALTGTGLAWSGSATGSATQFVGGSVTQTVTGATVSGIAYNYVALTGNTQVNKMTITLLNSTGKDFALTTLADSGTDNGYGGSATLWSCSDTGSAAAGNTASITGLAGNTVICEPSDGVATVGYYTGLNKVTVAIS
jgi:hypothetical protein